MIDNVKQALEEAQEELAVEEEMTAEPIVEEETTEAATDNDEAQTPEEEVAADESAAPEETPAEEATETVAEEEKEAPKEETAPAKEESFDEAQDKTAKEEVKEETPAAVDPGKWYIVHTYSGHEDKVAKTLNQRVETMGFKGKIFDIIVPTRNTIKVSQGKKESVKERIFPGYVLVKMDLNDETWLLVRTTPGVTAFIGAGNKPTPISEKEVEAIKKFMKMEEPLYKASFSVGEAVKIVDGPFADFLGTIDEIDDAKGKVKVLVSIFGRETPVELDFLQVNKL